MSPFILPGLTPEDATKICMDQCEAMCCRGQLILELTAVEVSTFREEAKILGVEAQITQTPSGGGWVRFSDHDGERCPMLDGTTFACRAYDKRPQRCRDFPERLTPGCAISGGV